MRRSLYLVIVLSFFMFVSNAAAKSIYYINDKGVTFTKEEYDFLDYMFWEGSQDLMTQDDYSRFIASDIMHGELGQETTQVGSDIMPLDNTQVSDRTGLLKIAKSCDTTCLISLTFRWQVIPTIKQYDVIGALFVDTESFNTPSVSVSYTNTTISYNSNMKRFTKGTNGSSYNGFGSSVALPSNDGAVVNATFRVMPGGHIYGSYQHASKEISLANSKKYTLSRAGEGGVFEFTGVAYDVYDRSPGVDITL